MQRVSAVRPVPQIDDSAQSSERRRHQRVYGGEHASPGGSSRWGPTTGPLRHSRFLAPGEE
jgi:hypothetical protein